MYFVWISEQTAIISLYSINWLVFITETECLLRGTDWIFKLIQFSLYAQRNNIRTFSTLRLYVNAIYPNQIYINVTIFQ